MLLKRALLLATLPVVLFSCVKKDDPTIVDPPPARKDVHLYFDNFAGNDALKLNSTTYTNEWGETFTVSMFNYYISNIKLNGPSGTYTESESYHLIREGIEGSMHLHLEEVPAGTYNSITFTIGGRQRTKCRWSSIRCIGKGERYVLGLEHRVYHGQAGR